MITVKFVSLFIFFFVSGTCKEELQMHKNY